MSGYLWGIPDDLEQRAATLAQSANTRRMQGVVRRLNPDPPAPPTDPYPFTVPQNTTVFFDVFTVDPTFTIHEVGETDSFTVSGGILALKATRDGHFKEGGYSVAVDFDQAGSGITWTIDIVVGILLGQGGEIILRTESKDGIVSNQGSRIAVNHAEIAAGPDWEFLSGLPGWNGFLDVAFMIAHNSNQDEDILVENALVSVRPTGGPQIF